MHLHPIIHNVIAILVGVQFSISASAHSYRRLCLVRPNANFFLRSLRYPSPAPHPEPCLFLLLLCLCLFLLPLLPSPSFLQGQRKSQSVISVLRSQPTPLATSIAPLPQGCRGDVVGNDAHFLGNTSKARKSDLSFSKVRRKEKGIWV